VLLVTGFPFWALGDGQRMRVLALVWVLGRQVDLSVLYLGLAGEADRQRLRELRVGADFHALGAGLGPQAQAEAVHALCRERRFDCCILERLALDHLRPALPAGVRTVLDSHDLLSGRSLSRLGQGLAGEVLSLEAELAVFARYDRVLMIQREEYELVAAQLPGRALLVPHPVVFPRRAVRPAGRSLGFVGARNQPNLHGLDWLADHVAPHLAGQPVDVELFGSAGEAWRPGQHAAWRRHGFVADFNRVWGDMDVAINPVRWGSGLKIKSVEALGNGLPLVTTREGARGLAELDGQALVIADEPADFAQACLRLLADPDARRRLGEAGHAYAQQRLSPQACFGELVAWLLG